MQLARLLCVTLKPPERRVKRDRIQMPKVAHENKKRRDEIFVELDETLEYFF